MFRTNNNGKLRYKFVSEEFIKIVTFVPLIFACINLLGYFSVGTKSLLYFLFVFCFSMTWFIIGIYATFRMAMRQNRTISEISFEKDYVLIKTDKVAWINAKEYGSDIDKLYYENREFDTYGKNTIREGLVIFIEDVEFYLVKDYFDDYDEIIMILNQFKQII